MSACQKQKVDPGPENGHTVSIFDKEINSSIEDHMKVSLVRRADGRYCNIGRAFSGPTRCGSVIQLERTKLRLCEKIGSGGYGSVSRAVVLGDGTNGGRIVAVKIQKRSCTWDLFMALTIARRVEHTKVQCFMQVLCGFDYIDRSFLLCEHHQGLTLHELVNMYIKQDRRMHEVVAMHYAVELLKLLEVLVRTAPHSPHHSLRDACDSRCACFCVLLAPMLVRGRMSCLWR